VPSRLRPPDRSSSRLRSLCRALRRQRTTGRDRVLGSLRRLTLRDSRPTRRDRVPGSDMADWWLAVAAGATRQADQRPTRHGHRRPPQLPDPAAARPTRRNRETQDPTADFRRSVAALGQALSASCHTPPSYPVCATPGSARCPMARGRGRGLRLETGRETSSRLGQPSSHVRFARCWPVSGSVASAHSVSSTWGMGGGWAGGTLDPGEDVRAPPWGAGCQKYVNEASCGL
jgi:hypothetical protein